jgi:HAD superfamily hydrolase (TIGR01509 family)
LFAAAFSRKTAYTFAHAALAARMSAHGWASPSFSSLPEESNGEPAKRDWSTSSALKRALSDISGARIDNGRMENAHQQSQPARGLTGGDWRAKRSAMSHASRSFALPRPVKAVVFDLDGTLVDSESLVRDGYFAAARRFAIPFAEAQFLTLIGKHRAENDAQLRMMFGEDFPLDAFHAEVVAEIGDRVAPMKRGAKEMMARLEAERIPFGLATSSGRGWVERIFRAHDLAARFSAIVTRDDVENRKPHPDPYLKAAAALGVAPADALAFEDSPTGFAAAHMAGMMTVIVPDLIAPDADMRERAMLIAHSLDEARALIFGD